MTGPKLLEFIRPAWYDHAACNTPDVPTAWFFPQRYVDPRALRLCQQCPVRVPCAARGSGETGIWGGIDRTPRKDAA